VLKLLALALLLANAGYFAWGHNLLAAYGLSPARQSEPERLARQINPEMLQIAAPARADQPAPPPPPAEKPPDGTQCLQAGVFTEQQARALRPRLEAGLPEGSWSFETSGEAVRWIIYMGKYISKEAMNRKRVKLEQLGLAFEQPVSPKLNPGLSLGSFASKAEAERALSEMNQRGIRSAKVVLERPELPSLWLRLRAADVVQRNRLDALKPLLAGKAVQACQ
jgi:hypothetical protein